MTALEAQPWASEPRDSEPLEPELLDAELLCGREVLEHSEPAGPVLAPVGDLEVDRPAGLDRSLFGVVIPVLSGSSGAGASVFAAAAVDVLQQAGRNVLLVDPAEPSRSGLSAAAAVGGAALSHPVPGVAVRYSWRGQAVLAQVEPDGLPALAPIPALSPAQWLPPGGLSPLHVTIADLGADWSAATPTPLHGASGWLRTGPPGGPRPWPVLVVRATRPSLLAAEAALAQLDPWIRAGQAVAPARLVVMASWKRRGWPAGVTGAAGSRVGALLDSAVFVPADREMDLGGITEAPVPRRVQDAVATLLHDWDLLSSGPGR